ncbi:MAG: hypothetical protein ACOX5M_05945 [Bacillota bacterium]
MTVAIPIHMKSWLFKVEPFVVLAGPAKTALIPVDKKRYESITSQDTHGTYLDRLSGTMAAFAQYAETLASSPMDEVITNHPGSIVIDSAKIKAVSLRIDEEAVRNRGIGYYTLEIVTEQKKYRGTVDRGTNEEGKAEALKEVFGSRFK